MPRTMTPFGGLNTKEKEAYRFWVSLLQSRNTLPLRVPFSLQQGPFLQRGDRSFHDMSSGEPTLESIWHKHKIIALSYWSWKFSGMLAQINAKEFSRNYRQWFSRILEKSQDIGEKFRTYGFGIDRGSATKIGWALNKIHLKLGRIL